MWKVTNSSVVFFSSLSVVHCRNVELMTLNIALLRRQLKYCETPSSFELALFSVFLIALRYIFCFWTFFFCCFNLFVSFLGFPKGASTVTKGLHIHYNVRGRNSCFKKKRKKIGTIISGTPQHISLRGCIGKTFFSFLTFRYAAA